MSSKKSNKPTEGTTNEKIVNNQQDNTVNPTQSTNDQDNSNITDNIQADIASSNTNNSENINNEKENIETENNQENNNTNKIKELMEEIKLLKEQIEVITQERDNYKDALLRKAAELENFRRIKEKEFADFAKYSSEKILLKFIEIYDDLEKAISYVDTPEHFNALKDGVVMVFNKFTKLLDSEEVKKIDAEGEDFNVDLHDALMQQPTDKMEPNKVFKVIENGYIYKDKILKHAKVIVTKPLNEN